MGYECWFQCSRAQYSASGTPISVFDTLMSALCVMMNLGGTRVILWLWRLFARELSRKLFFSCVRSMRMAELSYLASLDESAIALHCSLQALGGIGSSVLM